MAVIKPVMNNSLLSDYYDILEVDKKASLKEIREAYLSLCKDLHPDKLPADSGQNLKKLAEERLKLINEAYEILKDGDLRSEYDQYYGISTGEIVQRSIQIMWKSLQIAWKNYFLLLCYQKDVTIFKVKNK